jgi:hypothetical protein
MEDHVPVGNAPRDATRTVSDHPVMSYRSGRARVSHILVVTGGWLLFLLLWARVLVRPAAFDAIRSTLALVVVLVAVVITGTWLWVVHNVALARRRAGRRGSAPPPSLPLHDGLGRRLHIDQLASSASRIVVRADDTVKSFVVDEMPRG